MKSAFSRCKLAIKTTCSSTVNVLLNNLLLVFYFQEDMSKYTGVRVKPRADGTIMYGCQIHIGKVKRWVGQWPTEEEAPRAYDYFCMHEYGEERALKKLNFPEHRHRVDELAPPGIRQITKDMEREHRMTQV